MTKPDDSDHQPEPCGWCAGSTDLMFHFDKTITLTIEGLDEDGRAAAALLGHDIPEGAESFSLDVTSLCSECIPAETYARWSETVLPAG